MSPIDYLDFDLEIERAAQNYHAEINCPAGQSSCAFSLPFSDLELENFLLRVGHSVRGMRRIDSPEVEAAKAFGSRLFNAVFADEFRACLRSSLDEAEQQGKGLRIRLRLNDVPELADLPWEYLYNPALNRFLVLSNKTPLVRYMELPERIRPLALTPPLHMLVMIASPSNYAPLDVEREWDKLRASLQPLEQRGLVTLERVRPSLAVLQQQLRRDTYHILHFMGHGGFDERTQDGVLLLEDEDGLGDRVSGQDLGTLLHDHSSLRLAVLNACEGARASRTDPFAGTAQSLVQQGVPAVIAMQFEVSDEAAITLAREFYGAIADGYPADAALAEARKAIFATSNGVEWGTPVLYLRAPDGKIFHIVPASAPDSISPVPAAPATPPLQPAPTTVRSAETAAVTAAQPAPLGRRWYSAAAAVGVVVLLALLAFLFFDRFGPTSPPEPTALVPKSVSASSSSASNFDSQGNPVRYDPENAIDGKHDTAWRVDGDGAEQWLQLDFATAVAVQKVGIIPGYDKIDLFDDTDRFVQNRVVKKVRLEFSNGTAREASFEHQRNMQFVVLPQPIRTRFVRIVIVETYPPAPDGRDFTPISEVVVEGTP